MKARLRAVIRLVPLQPAHVRSELLLRRRMTYRHHAPDQDAIRAFQSNGRRSSDSIAEYEKLGKGEASRIFARAEGGLGVSSPLDALGANRASWSRLVVFAELNAALYKAWGAS